jgi:hypothetical protein
VKRLRREGDDDRLEETSAQRPPATPAIAGLARLQQTAGNASVARMLARQAAPAFANAEPDLEPHATGQDTDTPEALADSESGTLHVDEAELKAPLETARTEATPQSDANKEIADWVARPVATNREYAQWILDAGRHSFVTFGNNSEKQLQTYAAGGKHELTGPRELGGSVDGSQADKLPMLEIVHSLVSGRVNRWLPSPTKVRPSLEIGWLARNLKGDITDAHKTGAAVDLGALVAWDSPKGAAQVIQILTDLPKGNHYKIGLPFSGPFFDLDDSLLHFTNLAEKEAGAGAPADVTTPWLVMWESPLSTAKWDPATKTWTKSRVSGTNARSKIKDDALRAKLGGFDGKTFLVMPDMPRHIHIQKA